MPHNGRVFNVIRIREGAFNQHQVHTRKGLQFYFLSSISAGKKKIGMSSLRVIADFMYSLWRTSTGCMLPCVYCQSVCTFPGLPSVQLYFHVLASIWKQLYITLSFNYYLELLCGIFSSSFTSFDVATPKIEILGALALFPTLKPHLTSSSLL